MLHAIQRQSAGHAVRAAVSPNAVARAVALAAVAAVAVAGPACGASTDRARPVTAGAAGEPAETRASADSEPGFERARTGPAEIADPAGGDDRAGDPGSAGAAGASGASIQAGLAAHRGALDQCYQREAARAPELAGVVVLRFTIHPDGRLTEPKVSSSTLGNEPVERCLLGVIGAARIGAGVVAQPVGYALTLQFSGGAGGAGNGGNAGNAGNGGNAGASNGLQPRKDGPLEGAAISAVMNEKRAAFSACYDRHARKNPALAGRVVLRFTIRDDGTVRNVKIRESTLGHKGVERCIVAVGEKLRFPGEPGRAPTRVQYPFAFSAKR